MDADSRRMLADLGLERRDLVSAPVEAPRRRDYREDPNEQAAVAAEFEARRQNHSSDATGGGGDARAARLKAWNTQGTFETDEVTGQLENRWSGQGHRAQLNRRQLNSDDPWESIDARCGEERRLYLQEKGRNVSSHPLATVTGTGQGRFRDQILNGKSSPQRRRSKGDQTDWLRRPPPPRGPERVRAPSPRRLGTVRFGPSSRRSNNGSTGDTGVVSNPGLAAAAALRASASNTEGVTSSAPASSTSSTHSSDASGLPKVNNPGLAAAAALRASAVSGAEAQKPTTNVPTSPSPRTTTTQATLPRPNPPVIDSAPPAMCHNLALWWAAHPGKGCDDYHKSHPTRLKYLGPARDQLIKEAIALAKHDDEQETIIYLETHKERKWMIDAAKKAKLQVEQDSDDQILEYCDTHARQMSFIRAAMAVFTPSRSVDAMLRTRTTATCAPAITSSPVKTSSAEYEGSSSDSEMDESTETAASSPCRSGRGTLAATFWDVAGKFLGSHRVSVDAPIHATMDVTSKAHYFNPRELINCIEAVAKNMIDRTHGLEGVRLAEDGLWVEEEL